MLNILTIDVEDYFQVHAFSNVIRYEDWDKYECRVERNTDRILAMLTAAPQHRSTAVLPKGTFFVLGWIAERYPELIKRIQKEGHEIACHGYRHKLIYHQSREDFRKDIRKAKAILEDVIGGEVIGYRSPSYSVTKKSQWALEILAEEGFRYDSSIFPIRHDFYGMPDAPRFPFLISINGKSNVGFSFLNYELETAALADGGTAARNHSNNSFSHSLINNSLKSSKPNIPIPQSAFRIPHSIVEFPISTIRILGVNFPISGGGYFRLLPYPLIKKGLRSINEKESKPFIFYVHPWEFDPDQPHIKNAANLSKFRHYLNLNKTEERFRKLLEDFRFSTIRQILIQNS